MSKTRTSNAFVTYPTESLMYIIIDDLFTFEAIAIDEDQVAGRVVGNGRMARTKQGEINGVTVIFQYWPPKKEEKAEVSG